MRIEVRTDCWSADWAGPMRQLEAAFGPELARRAALEPPFVKLAILSIQPAAFHPAVGIQGKPRSRYERSLDTCFSEAVVEYPALVSPVWKTRVEGYAAAIRAAVQTVAKSRIGIDERTRLREIIDDAAAMIAGQPPDEISPAKPVYVTVTTDGQWEAVSFAGPAQGMLEVRAEDCLRDLELASPAEQGPSAFKLYRERGGGREYHEAWPGEGIVVEHWGRCGERGEARELPARTGSDLARVLAELESGARNAGFRPVEPGAHATLVVEYRMPPGRNAARTSPDRAELEEALDQLIGWLGLGHCDGGSTGSGTMEVFLDVVDFECAKAALVRELASGPHAGFSRIYRM